MTKALITTIPFGEKDPLPLDALDDAGIEWQINPLKRKLSESELAELVSGYDCIIAGTETISERVMDNATNLKMISRVGIGLDGVDLNAARERGISVSYTPDAPAPAVAELTLCMILSLLRSAHIANAQMHRGEWDRIFGRRLAEITVGIIGVGRIGGRVIQSLKAFGPSRLLVNDIHPNRIKVHGLKLEWCSKQTIYKEADVICLHLPLTKQTHNLIKKEQLLSMKKDAVIINPSRGGIINEQDLYEVLKMGYLSGAALDVFEQEPYAGNLREIERCMLTSHMGSMTLDCRNRMEIEATEEVIRFFARGEQRNPVPEFEYDIRR